MSKNVISLDLGYGDSKLCLGDPTNPDNLVKFITNLVKLDEVNDKIVDENIYEFDGEKYYMLDLATRIPKEPIDIMSYEGLKEASPVLVSYFMKKLKIDRVDELKVGLSMAMHDKKDDYIDYLSEKLNIEKNKITLTLQGVGCHLAYSKYGDDVSKDIQGEKSKNYIVCDLGFNTIDVAPVIEGNLSATLVKGMEGKGVCIIANNLISYAKTNNDLNLTIADAKKIIATGSHGKRGKKIDFSSTVNNLVMEYLQHTIKYIEDEFADEIDRMDNLFLVGGGANIITNQLQRSESFKSEIEELYGDDFLIIPKSHSEYYNAIGYYLA